MEYKLTVIKAPLFNPFSPEKELSYDFDREKRILKIETSSNIAMGNYNSINVVDNNINFISASDHLKYIGLDSPCRTADFTCTGEYLDSVLDEEEIMTTVGAVNEESSNALSKKVHTICSDLYEPTKERWSEPINIQFVDSGTGTIYKDFWVQMESSTTATGFSSWSFTSSENSTILIKQNAIDLNKQQPQRKRADLNLLALFFILKTALPRVNLLSGDTGIKESKITFYAT